MSQAEIGNLRVRLGIDTAEFANGVRSVQGSLAGLTSSLKAFAGAAAATTLLNSAVDAMKAVAEIGDVAESIGVSAEQLQAFQKMALASGASTDVLTRGLQSIAEQSVDTGSKLAQLFEANGLSVKGKETNQIIREFMDLVRNAATPAEQLAIITGVLGDKVGRQLVEAFREGAAGADEATRQMVASGEFHTDAEVRRLQELETKYNQTVDRIATYWRNTIIGIVNLADKVELKYIPGAGGGRSAVSNRLNTKPPVVPNMGPMGGPGQFNFIPVRTTVLPPPKENTDVVRKRISEAVTPPPIPPGTIDDIYGAGEAVSALQENYQEAINGAGAFSDSLLSIGDTITSGVGSAISGLITGTMSVKEAFASMAQGIIQTMADLAAKLAVSAGFRILLSALGGGGGAGFNLGGMTFGGLYANGGTLGAGRWGIAGEAGPEIIHGPARITPMDKLGGQSAPLNVTVINNTAARVNTQKASDGSVRITIEDVVAEALARGGNKIDAAMTRGYGLRRAGR